MSQPEAARPHRKAGRAQRKADRRKAIAESARELRDRRLAALARPLPAPR